MLIIVHKKNFSLLFCKAGAASKFKMMPLHNTFKKQSFEAK
jgi:hypothetical protein